MTDNPDNNLSRLFGGMGLSSRPPIALQDDDRLAQYVKFKGKAEAGVVHLHLLPRNAHTLS